VLVLVFEEFIKKPDVYLGRIADFLGVEFPQIPLTRKNASRLGPIGLEVSRQLNYIFRSYLNPAGLVPGVPRIKDGRLTNISPVTYFHDHWPFRSKRTGVDRISQIAKRIFEETKDDNRLLDYDRNLRLSTYGYY